MKSLFILLLVINLLAFGWQYQRRNPSPQQDIQQQLPDGVKRLQFAGERVSTETEVVANMDEDTADAVDPEDEKLVSNADEVAPAPKLGMQTQDDGQTSEAVPTLDDELAQKGEQTLMGKADSELKDEPGPTSSEGSPGGGVGEPETTGVVAVSPTAPDTAEQPLPPRRCLTLGAFKKLSVVEAVTERLESQVEDLDWRQETREKQVGYWVLIPAQASRQAARVKVKELLDAGIEDVWRFTKGDLANAISLGLFSRKVQADRHRREIARKGFTTEVRPRVVNETIYWLDFRAKDNQALPPKLKDDLARDYAGVNMSSRECPSDAAR